MSEPASNQEEKRQPVVNSNLMKCRTCEHKMAMSAEHCPGCGAKNEYIHPRIKEFLDEFDDSKLTPCQYTYSNTTIQFISNAKNKVSSSTNYIYWGIIVIVVGYFIHPAITLPGIALTFWGVIRTALLKQSDYLPESLEIDFSSAPPKWKSTNDRIWKPIMEYFKIA